MWQILRALFRQFCYLILVGVDAVWSLQESLDKRGHRRTR
jgi:hypothetical protein